MVTFGNEKPRTREGQENVLHWRSVTRHVGAVTRYAAYPDQEKRETH